MKRSIRIRIALFLIMILANAFISNGQIEKQLNSILLKRDFKAFVDFAENYYMEKDGIRISKGNIREIAEGYQEAIFYISKAHELNKVVNITVNPKLRMIIQGNRIIYFHLESKVMKDYPKSFESTIDTIYRYVDGPGMANLKNRFESEYKTTLKDEDLFIDTIAVGTKCGHYPGEFTRAHVQILQWVQAIDTASLFKWLQSANSEKQVYAIRGLYYLSLRGIKISDEKKLIVGRVRRKNGTVYTCVPCDLRETFIKKELESFPF